MRHLINFKILLTFIPIPGYDARWRIEVFSLRKNPFGNWGESWTSLGGEFKSPFIITSWVLGQLSIFAVGIDNAVYHKYNESRSALKTCV
jgi:predicted membrane chloride channel (bestrophin family)